MPYLPEAKLNPTSYFNTDCFATRDVTLPRLQKCSLNVIQCLTDAVKLVAAHWLRDEARAAAYRRLELLQAPASAPVPT